MVSTMGTPFDNAERMTQDSSKDSVTEILAAVFGSIAIVIVVGVLFWYVRRRYIRHLTAPKVRMTSDSPEGSVHSLEEVVVPRRQPSPLSASSYDSENYVGYHHRMAPLPRPRRPGQIVLEPAVLGLPARRGAYAEHVSEPSATSVSGRSSPRSETIDGAQVEERVVRDHGEFDLGTRPIPPLPAFASDSEEGSESSFDTVRAVVARRSGNAGRIPAPRPTHLITDPIPPLPVFTIDSDEDSNRSVSRTPSPDTVGGVEEPGNGLFGGHLPVLRRAPLPTLDEVGAGDQVRMDAIPPRTSSLPTHPEEALRELPPLRRRSRRVPGALRLVWSRDAMPPGQAQQGAIGQEDEGLTLDEFLEAVRNGTAFGRRVRNRDSVDTLPRYTPPPEYRSQADSDEAAMREAVTSAPVDTQERPDDSSPVSPPHSI